LPDQPAPGSTSYFLGANAYWLQVGAGLLWAWEEVASHAGLLLADLNLLHPVPPALQDAAQVGRQTISLLLCLLSPQPNQHLLACV
jgi:hypothetical protein